MARRRAGKAASHKWSDSRVERKQRSSDVDAGVGGDADNRVQRRETQSNKDASEGISIS